jgi:CRP-like cAMP-binding protein
MAKQGQHENDAIDQAELAALLGLPEYHGFAQASTAVEVWTIPVDRLAAELAWNPALLTAVGAALSRRLALTEALLRDVTLLPVRERVDDALARLGPCLGGEAPQLTRAALAGLVGARRETVSRAVGGRSAA